MTGYGWLDAHMEAVDLLPNAPSMDVRRTEIDSNVLRQLDTILIGRGLDPVISGGHLCKLLPASQVGSYEIKTTLQSEYDVTVGTHLVAACNDLFAQCGGVNMSTDQLVSAVHQLAVFRLQPFTTPFIAELYARLAQADDKCAFLGLAMTSSWSDHPAQLHLLHQQSGVHPVQLEQTESFKYQMPWTEGAPETPMIT